MSQFKDDVAKMIVDKVVAEFRNMDLYDAEMPIWLSKLPSGQYTVSDLILVSLVWPQIS